MIEPTSKMQAMFFYDGEVNLPEPSKNVEIMVRKITKEGCKYFSVLAVFIYQEVDGCPYIFEAVVEEDKPVKVALEMVVAWRYLHSD